MNTILIHGKCEEELPLLPESSVDSVVTDPPYGIKFMGKKWDYAIPTVEQWEEVYRVMKPGAYLLAFGGTRTFHRMAVAIEDAGFEIQDTISWLYGSGFPKHKSKLKPAWEPIIVARKPAKTATPLNIDACRIGTDDNLNGGGYSSGDPTGMWRDGGENGGLRRLPGQFEQPSGRWPANVVLDDEAAALLDEMSGERPGMPRTVKRTGTDSVGYDGGWNRNDASMSPGYGDTGGASRFFFVAQSGIIEPWNNDDVTTAQSNLSQDEQAAVFVQSGAATSDCHAATPSNGCPAPTTNATPNGSKPNGKSDTPTTPSTEQRYSPECQPISTSPLSHVSDAAIPTPTDTTKTMHDPMTCGSCADPATSNSTPNNSVLGVDLEGAARFLYTAKASRSERNAGLEGMPEREGGAYANGAGMPGRSFIDGQWVQTGTWQEPNRTPRQNHHPTVKPISLMRWLVRLVTPPGGTVLDPFAGSGTTGCAAALERFDFIGIELNNEYIDISEKRIEYWMNQRKEI